MRFYVEQHEVEHAGNEVNPPEPVTGLLVINDYDIWSGSIYLAQNIAQDLA